MKTLLFTVGLPRSGKSTWAKSTGLPIVNRDSIRLALHGQPFLKESEDMVTAMEKYMVKSLFLAGHDTIIIDATNLKIKYIKAWKYLGIENVKFKFKVFDTQIHTCIERAFATNKPFLVPVIESMFEDFTALLDEIYSKENYKS